MQEKGDFLGDFSLKTDKSIVLGKESNLFRNADNFFRNRVNFFRKPILRKVLFFGGGELSRSSLGVLSVVGRWNEARYKRGKRGGNLNICTV